MICGSANISSIKRSKRVWPGNQVLSLLAVGMFMSVVLFSCENDLKKVQQLSAQEVNSPLERTTDVDILYSDSARIKAHMTTPLLLRNTKDTRNIMPKGVKVVFFGKKMDTTSTITSEYALWRENDKIVELRKNVVATNNKGEIFKSDELIWNQQTHKVTSGKPVHIILSGGGYFDASGLETNEQFSPWAMPRTTGAVPVDQNITKP